jgi:hypothetical protein
MVTLNLSDQEIKELAEKSGLSVLESLGIMKIINDMLIARAVAEEAKRQSDEDFRRWENNGGY